MPPLVAGEWLSLSVPEQLSVVFVKKNRKKIEREKEKLKTACCKSTIKELIAFIYPGLID